MRKELTGFMSQALNPSMGLDKQEPKKESIMSTELGRIISDYDNDKQHGFLNSKGVRVIEDGKDRALLSIERVQGNLVMVLTIAPLVK